MDKQTFKMLELFYDENELSIASNKSPYINFNSDKKNSIKHLKDNGYLDYNETTGIFKITIPGKAYVEGHRQRSKEIYWRIATLIISLLALLKPPSFDIIAILKQLML